MNIHDVTIKQTYVTIEKVRHELQVAGKKLSRKFSSKILTVFIDISTFFYTAGITVFCNILHYVFIYCCDFNVEGHLK